MTEKLTKINSKIQQKITELSIKTSAKDKNSIEEVYFPLSNQEEYNTIQTIFNHNLGQPYFY